MKAKGYLEEIRRLDKLISSLVDEYESIKSLATRITATYEGEMVQSSRKQDKLGDIVVKLVDYEHKINAEIDKYVDTRENILQVIQLLDIPDYVNVLYKRYYQYKKWELIACEMGYSLRGILKLHGRALNAVDNILKGEKK